MKITMGNPSPHDQGRPVPGPALTISFVLDDKLEDGSYRTGYIVGTDAAAVRDHLFDNPGMTTHMPGNGAILGLVGSFREQSNGRPAWVAVDPQERSDEEGEDLERFLSEFWRCDRGIPADVEDTHFTASGPPGTGPAELAEGE